MPILLNNHARIVIMVSDFYSTDSKIIDFFVYKNQYWCRSGDITYWNKLGNAYLDAFSRCGLMKKKRWWIIIKYLFNYKWVYTNKFRSIMLDLYFHFPPNISITYSTHSRYIFLSLVIYLFIFPSLREEKFRGIYATLKFINSQNNKIKQVFEF